MKQGRFFRQKPKELLGTKFDSTTEQTLYNTLQKILPGSTTENLSSDSQNEPSGGIEWQFHESKIKYTIEKTYNPDFTISKGDQRVYIEVKGYFQDSPEAAKYLWVRDVLGPNEELVFLFEKPETKIHYLKPRQDGTKMTMAEWADKHGFRWFTMDNIQEVVLD